MGLNALDWAVIAVYLTGVTLFGMRFRSRERTIQGYFLAGNQIPWWAISISIVAAETSTLTVISVPGIAYATDFRFLQLAMGYVLGRVLVAWILIPHYFRGELVTAYELIDRRFGPGLRSLTAALFLVTRAAAEGVRIFAVAIVVRIALGRALSGLSDLASDAAAIVIVTLLTLAYTFKGGMTAVIWTDVVQLAIYVSGTVVGLFTLLHFIPGGWQTVHAIAAPSQKFRVLDPSWNPLEAYTLWSGIIGGAFLTMASHGTDQLIVQRLLAARNERQSKVALVTSGGAVFLLFALFLLLGAMLFVYYRLSPPDAPFGRTDRIFPTFVASRMPHGISGLLIAAILAAAMSNLSAAFNSLSASTIVDFYARLRPQSAEERRVRLARISTIAWAAVLCAIALLARRGGRVLEMGLSIASVAYGAMLGVFLLGVLTRRATQVGAGVGMVAGFALNIYLWRFTRVPFPWYVALGSVATFAVGYGASLLTPPGRQMENRDASEAINDAL